MILNLTRKMGEHLLVTVDAAADVLLEQIPKAKGKARAEMIVTLKCLGGVKHRLHYGLGLPPFSGPIEWGYPIEGSELHR